MQLLNATKMQAAYTLGVRPDGREVLVVVVKGTFAIPSNPAAEPTLAPVATPAATAQQDLGAGSYRA